MVLLATFASLRWGEVVALQRKDLDLTAGSLEVRQAHVEARGVGLMLGPPKSRAGVRTVAFPPFLRKPLRKHLVGAADDPEAFLLTTDAGRPIWRGNFNKLVGWPAAVAAIGRPGLHFHDLRHTGNTLAADSGTSLRNLMIRMGHEPPRCAGLPAHRPGARPPDRQLPKLPHRAGARSGT